jgi:hypothetical protein
MPSVPSSAAREEGRPEGGPDGAVGGEEEEELVLDDLGRVDLKPFLLAACDLGAARVAVVSDSVEASLDVVGLASPVSSAASAASDEFGVSADCNLAPSVPKHAVVGRAARRKTKGLVPARGVAARKACRPTNIVPV